jgi:thioredoxin reductase
MARVVVLGGGIVGVTTAITLQRNGRRHDSRTRPRPTTPTTTDFSISSPVSVSDGPPQLRGRDRASGYPPRPGRRCLALQPRSGMLVQ